MPHTSRRKKNTPTKRVEVVDGEGWTRVTTTGRARQAPGVAHSHPQDSFGLSKTTPEKGATVGKITHEYEKIREQWLASDACIALDSLLRQHASAEQIQFDACLLFGSGSFCGLRQGWIQRTGAAMCQLAVMQTMRSTLEEITTKSIPIYAQDPAYNDLDIDFLQAMKVEVLETPAGFDLITDKSIAYTPCAEAHVELQVLRQAPAVLLTSKLDWYWRNEKGQACTSRVVATTTEPQSAASQVEDSSDGDETDEARLLEALSIRDIEEECKTLENFLQNKQGSSLRVFELKDQYPFSSQHLYWPKLTEDEVTGKS